ncbi:hypothetical protein ACFFV7_35760 [Nonomuraea spiralis]|uniref:Secreted protein n=1 Tax=Nonomuraea spiralis TaxID=46182 RepID=A0ABV5IQJ0_9ACTN|nr:hypothetical protein [Nonomuraea spiralis]GGT11167.1 hypothetical protein GCM10010176_064660 [Nonomuraea spiralis]
MKTVTRALKASLCALAAGGALLAAAPAASAESWHWISRHDTWVGCHTMAVVDFGGWPSERVKCEIEGTWSPWQTYALYVYY